MNNKFTNKAEEALKKALKYAEELGHSYIGTEHLLLALCDDDNSVSGYILKKCGLYKENLSSQIEAFSGKGTKSGLNASNMTPRAKLIIEKSYDIAQKYSKGVVGTEHILLSLLEEKSSVAAKILSNMGKEPAKIREQALSVI